METTMMIPRGFRFAPTDEELIKYYLLRKAMGMSLPCDLILEKNLYGQNADPWNVFNNNVSDDSHWDTSYSGSKESKTYVKKSTYVVTKLSKVNGKKRIARTAGCGTWDGQTGGRKIYDQSTGEEIGLMKMFSFQSKKAVSGDDTDDHWIMHEYSLSGVSLRCELKYEDYVICKITRSLSKEKYDREEKQRFSDMHVILNKTGEEDDLLGKKRALEVQLEDDGSRDHKKQCKGSTAELDLEDDNLFAAELEEDLSADLFAAELEDDLSLMNVEEGLLGEKMRSFEELLHEDTTELSQVGTWTATMDPPYRTDGDGMASESQFGKWTATMDPPDRSNGDGIASTLAADDFSNWQQHCHYYSLEDIWA